VNYLAKREFLYFPAFSDELEIQAALKVMKEYSNVDKLVLTPTPQGIFIKGSTHYKRHEDCACPAPVRILGRLVEYPGTFPCPVHGFERSQSI
jgi:hypothetical protein